MDEAVISRELIERENAGRLQEPTVDAGRAKRGQEVDGGEADRKKSVIEAALARARARKGGTD